MANFNPVNDTSIEDGINLYESKAQMAIDALKSKGFGIPNPPMMQTSVGLQPYQGHIPPNLPDLSDNELGTYMGLLSEWNNYVQSQLAEASVQLAKSKAILEHVEGKLRIAYGTDENDKKRTVQERDDFKTADRRYIQANSDVIYWDTLYTSIRAIANSAEQAFSAVSRRITQRGQEIDRGNRTNGVNNIPSGPMFGRNRT
jgi:hypothetical protein